MAISVSTMFFSICSRGVALSIRNIHMYVCMYMYIHIQLHIIFWCFRRDAASSEAFVAPQASIVRQFRPRVDRVTRCLRSPSLWRPSEETQVIAPGLPKW